jgi:NADP-dependent 3-hydroxy acid dehydrogenase YdfG
MSIVIVGAGPNLGAAIARRFGREGMPVGLVSRNGEKLERLAEDLGQEGITADFAAADIRDAAALSSAIGSLADRLGAIEVLEYSPSPRASTCSRCSTRPSTRFGPRWSSASSAQSPR